MGLSWHTFFHFDKSMGMHELDSRGHSLEILSWATPVGVGEILSILCWIVGSTVKVVAWTQEEAEVSVLSHECGNKSPSSGDKKAARFLGGDCIFGLSSRAGKQMDRFRSRLSRRKGEELQKRDTPREGET